MWALNTIEKGTYLSFEKQLKLFMLKVKGKKIAIWGASVRGIIAGMILEDMDIRDFEFIDSDKKKQGNKVSGHLIKSIDDTDLRSTYIILSMEYQDSVKRVLKDLQLLEGRDFSCLVSSDYDDLMKELKYKNSSNLLIGASALHVLPTVDKKGEDLADIIRNKFNVDLKILGMTCLGMRNMYHLIRTEIYQNPKLKSIAMIISWETLTSFHHLLPRTQKPHLIKLLKEYVGVLGNSQFEEELELEYRLAKDRSLNYNLENEYSPNRIDNSNSHSDVLKSYLDISIMEKLDEDCEEVNYLENILKFAGENDVRVILIIEPMNIDLCIKISKDCFIETYREKCNFITNLATKYEAMCYDASALINTEDFSAVNIVNEAIYMNGRYKFAEYIVDNLRKVGI